jgi:alanine-glyoxylate transaminase/serine-glyoxylate transaminase/serine-pyruvate transaminase
MIGEVVKRVSPDTLVVLDGVCSVASEEIRMDDWGIDVVLSASQKGLGTPPGLSVVCASQRALKVSLYAPILTIMGIKTASKDT